ncbi:hypothetical protein BKH42_06955 [Helicobacter sp. 13S00482-2]|uniref:GPW/gp25 family protein n=1 Tax=Helicobacter sp. 13S00482-2 TaxID=1476200 RepID=UPI000BA4FA35|nr:GPW/gp25 family protein [Helicobacter sp. 13S00482-2]PAF53259.1 hypothetical protein BKH42_06955 [Helicobacter sp. 13S00482-2]
MNTYQISITENLTKIFKTKKYSLPLNPNYGLSYDFIDKPFSKELESSIIAEIKEQIELFEPRVKITSIQILKEDANLIILINTNIRISL